MARLSSFFFLLFVTVCIADDGGTTLGPPTVPTTDPSKTTAETTIPTVTTVPTLPPTTIETTAPPVATTTPPPTTVAPPTIPPATSPVTVSPNPFTTWPVTDATGNVCIISTMDVTFTVDYNTTTDKTVTAVIQVPQSAKVDTTKSSCNALFPRGDQMLTLQWSNGDFLYNLSLTFTPKDASKATVLKTVQFDYDLRDAKTFPNAKQLPGMMMSAFATSDPTIIPPDSYLQCVTGVSMTFETDNTGGNFTATGIFKQLRLDAFRNSTTKTFDDNQFLCPGDQVSTTPATPTTPVPMNVPVYNVTEYGYICLKAQFDLTMTIMYEQRQPDNSTKTVNATMYSLNGGSIDHSFCNATEGRLVIEDFFKENTDWIVSFVFTQNSNKFQLSEVDLQFSLKNSSHIFNATHAEIQDANRHSLTKWQATVDHSYKCFRQDVIELDTSALHGVSKIQLWLDYIQVQPFMSNGTNNGEWGTAEVCANTETSDIVPIAVGCALAALVVIVLIAYVVGRRRNRSRGYESM